ncbi:MAG: hypothetical protein ACKO37_10335 [Vampirovibrionales bacterium]
MMNSIPVTSSASVSVQAKPNTCVLQSGKKYCGIANTYIFQGGQKKLNVLFDDKNQKAVFLNGDGKTFDSNNVISYFKKGLQRAINIEDYQNPSGQDRQRRTADGLTLLEYNPKTPEKGNYTKITPDANNNPVWGEPGTYAPQK